MGDGGESSEEKWRSTEESVGASGDSPPSNYICHLRTQTAPMIVTGSKTECSSLCALRIVQGVA